MDTLTAIHTRHSIGAVKQDPLPRELIEKLLSAGAQAPNHYKVRPWRFFVLSGEARNRLGDAMAETFRAKFPDAPAGAEDKERAKPLRAPVIIAVGVDMPAADTKAVEIENIAAVAAACQNILLAAHDLGLGAIWRTGENARDPEIKKFFGLTPEQHLLAFIYVGYIDAMLDFPGRQGFEDRTVWME